MASAEHIKTSAGNSAAKPWLIMVTVTAATGLTAGLGGMVLGLLLHFVQHVAYGYGLHAIVSHESFLEGVKAFAALLGHEPRTYSSFAEELAKEWAAT